MSELLVAALKIAFLALLWLFILFAANVVRADMFGRSVAATSPELGAISEPAPRPRKRKKTRRNAPTKLVVSEGRQAGLEIPLLGVVGLGRAADSALNIDDDYASTRHAQLTQDDDGTWWVEDLGSTNGTSLNTKPLTAPAKVNAGDTIRIGRTVMTVVK